MLHQGAKKLQVSKTTRERPKSAPRSRFKKENALSMRIDTIVKKIKLTAPKKFSKKNKNPIFENKPSKIFVFPEKVS